MVTPVPVRSLKLNLLNLSSFNLDIKSIIGYRENTLDNSRDHSPSLLSLKNIYLVLYSSHHIHTYYLYNHFDNKYFFRIYLTKLIIKNV